MGILSTSQQISPRILLKPESVAVFRAVAPVGVIRFVAMWVVAIGQNREGEVLCKKSVHLCHRFFFSVFDPAGGVTLTLRTTSVAPSISPPVCVTEAAQP